MSLGELLFQLMVNSVLPLGIDVPGVLRVLVVGGVLFGDGGINGVLVDYGVVLDEGAMSLSGLWEMHTCELRDGLTKASLKSSTGTKTD